MSTVGSCRHFFPRKSNLFLETSLIFCRYLHVIKVWVKQNRLYPDVSYETLVLYSQSEQNIWRFNVFVSLLHSVHLKAVDNNYIVSQMSQNAAVLQNQNTNQQLIEQRNFWFSSDHFSKFSSILFKIPKISLFFIDRLSKSSLPRWPQGLLPLRALSGRRLGRWATTSWRSTPARRSTSTIGLNSNPCWPPNRGKRIRISSRRLKFQVSG